MSRAFSVQSMRTDIRQLSSVDATGVSLRNSVERPDFRDSGAARHAAAEQVLQCFVPNLLMKAVCVRADERDWTMLLSTAGHITATNPLGDRVQDLTAWR